MIPSLNKLIDAEKVAERQILEAKEEAKQIVLKAKKEAEQVTSEAEAEIRTVWKAKIPAAVEERKKFVRQKFEEEAARIQNLAKKNHKKVTDFVLKKALEVKE